MAEKRPISALPGSAPPQFDATFQLVPVPVLLQVRVADRAGELPQAIGPAKASPASAQRTQRTARIGIACRPKGLEGNFNFLRQQAVKLASSKPTANNTSVPGSGTATAPGETASGGATTGAAVAEGSKTNAPPAPIVKLVPSARALEFVTHSMPASTVVPPL